MPDPVTISTRPQRSLCVDREEGTLCGAQGVLHCDCDEETRPRAGYRPGAPGGRQVEHVDEHLRSAAWMGASPLSPAWCRVTNLHAGRDHQSRDRGCGDRAHRTTSQRRLTPGPLHPRTLANTGTTTPSSAPWVPLLGGGQGGRAPPRFSVPDAHPLDPRTRLLMRRPAEWVKGASRPGRAYSTAQPEGATAHSGGWTSRVDRTASVFVLSPVEGSRPNITHA